MEIIDHQELVNGAPPHMEHDATITDGLTERQRRIQRCLACLSSQLETSGTPVPLTMPNLSACLGIRIESQHLKPFVKRGELEITDAFVPANPFSRTNKPSRIYRYSERPLANPDCDVQQKLYTNILRSRGALDRSLIASLIAHAQNSPYFTRSQIIEGAAAKRRHYGYEFFSKIIELEYVESTQEQGEAGAEIFAHTPAGLNFLNFARGFLQIGDGTTTVIDFKAEPNHESELHRMALTELERGILTALAQSEPPYSIPAIAQAYPASGDKISDLLSKLEAQGYFSRLSETTPVTRAILFEPTDRGQELLSFHGQQTEIIRSSFTYPQLTLVDRLVKQGVIQPSESGTGSYSFTATMRAFTRAQLEAYLYLNNIDTIVLGRPCDIKWLDFTSGKQGYTSLEDFARPVQETIGYQRNIAERCIACVALRGLHQPGAQIHAQDIVACNPGASIRDARDALQEAYNQTPRILRRTTSSRMKKYTLTNIAPDHPILRVPETCANFTPVAETKSKRPRRNLDQVLRDIKLSDQQTTMLTHIQTYLSYQMDTLRCKRFLINLAHCMKYGLLDVDDDFDPDTAPTLPSSPGIPRLVIGRNLIHESEAFQQAIMHGLEFDPFVYGERLDPAQLRSQFGLRMTQTLKSFAEKHIEKNHGFKVEQISV